MRIRLLNPEHKKSRPAGRLFRALADESAGYSFTQKNAS